MYLLPDLHKRVLGGIQRILVVMEQAKRGVIDPTLVLDHQAVERLPVPLANPLDEFLFLASIHFLPPANGIHP
jgi:hypothetical protein